MTSNINLGPIIGDYSLRQVFVNDYSNLTVAHFNAQSLCPSNRAYKLDELVAVFRNASLDIICVTETWLDSTISDQAVKIPGYTICRSDRPYGSRGGGIAMFVAEGIKYKCIYRCEEYFACEGLFLEVGCGANCFAIGTVYLPRGNLHLFEESFSDLFVRYKNIIVVGDFNMDLFKPYKSLEVRLLCNRFGLTCWHNSLPTHYDSYHQSVSLIDFFLISNNMKVNTSAQFQIPFVSNHSLICASFQTPVDHVVNTSFF